MEEGTVKKSYVIKRVDKDNINRVGFWDDIPKASIDNYPWDNNGYMPETYVKLCYTEDGLYIRFFSKEPEIKAIYTKPNEPAYKDSCVELFINPNPYKDDRYMNFETNCIGTLLLGIGRGRQNRELISPKEQRVFNISTMLSVDTMSDYDGEGWDIIYTIPFSFIKKYYEQIEIGSGHEMLGNFYKCGDGTKYPHFGCWNRIENDMPDFHRPECFGKLILE